MRIRKTATGLAAALALVLAGCSSTPAAEPSPEPAEELTITDMAGREVSLQLPIERYAISTFDVIDFITPLIGEESFDKLVGVGNSGGKDAYDDIYNEMFPDLDERIGVISEHNAPFDLEMILAKKPDVLIVNSAMQAHTHALDIEAQLTDAGIELVLIDVPQDLATSSQEAVNLLGQVFGAEERASEVVEFIDDQFELVTSKNLASRQDRPTVYYEKSGTAEEFGTTSRSTSGWGAVVALAGGDNIAESLVGEGAGSPGGKGGPGGGSPTVDPEKVLTADPDFIFLSGTNSLGLGADPNLAAVADFSIVERPGWSELSAVQQGKVYELQHELSRTVVAFYPTLVMAQAMYPDEFSDVDPDALLAEFYDEFLLIDADQGVWKLQLPTA
ncbi:MAG: ABC transporter substrate-binding protein [Brooklawnia sp.]|jgi:iron complex transport system substrate-binding protein